MEKFYTKLEKTLKKDSRFIDQDGDLLKNNIIDAAYKGDKKLVEMLLSEKELKKKFFIETGNVSAFNINEFVSYISDKNFLADSYTKYCNKIGLNIGGKFLNERKEVALVWPFKDCVLEGGMTKDDEKRKEIFFNEILAQDEIDKLLAPKVLTNWKRYAADGDKFLPLPEGEIKRGRELNRDENGVIRENMIIKGNNLLALHSLKKQFQNKIKLIYIDPPYNTGNDSFGYNDNFNHSTWLTFMKNRLEAAKVLLRDDGVIFISCDDSEQAYLKVLCDEVFGRENFINNLVWIKKNVVQNDAKYFSENHDHILLFAKNKEVWRPNLLERSEELNSTYKNLDNDPRGPWVSVKMDAKSGTKSNYYEITFKNGIIWRPSEGRFPAYSKETLNNFYDEGRLWFGKDGKNIPRRKIYLSEVKQGITPNTVFYNDEVGSTQKAKEDLKRILGENVFGTPKPIELIKKIIKIGAQNDDIILDFFAGSGTTAQAVLELNREDGGNRKFILVEQMDYVGKVTVERVKKVIQNLGDKDLDFIYCELMKYNEKFIEKIGSAENFDSLLNIWEEMKEKSFLNYNVDIKKFDDNIDDFKKLPLIKQQRILFDFLNKNQLYINLSEIEDEEFGVGEGDKKLNKEFYGNK